MKKMSWKMILVVVITIFSVSCNDKGPVTLASPTVTTSAAVTNSVRTYNLANGGDVTVGAPITFAADVIAPGGFKALNIKGGFSSTFTDPSGVTSTVYSKTFVVPTDNGQLGQTITITFEALDKKGKMGTLDFTFKVVP